MSERETLTPRAAAWSKRKELLRGAECALMRIENNRHRISDGEWRLEVERLLQLLFAESVVNLERDK